MPHIDYFLFPISPFTYLAGNGLEEIAARHGATITYKPFALMEVFGLTGGTPPKDRHISRQAYRLQELARISKRVGLPLNLKPAHWPTNPVPAMTALIAAQEMGGGDIGKLSQALLRSCWADELDIAQDEVVNACLKEAGFADGLSMSAMAMASDVIAANTKEAVERNVFGAPSYLVDDQVFWGQDRLSYLDDYLSERSG